MIQFILKVLVIFFIIYGLWVVTGGPERGDERQSAGEIGSLLIGLDVNEEDDN